MEPLCAIDIGTNTLLAVVGRMHDDDRIERVADWAAITRLGAGVDANRMLAPDAMERALNVLVRFVDGARAMGVTRFGAVATSAVRDAQNRDDFVAAAKERSGIDVAVITGAREAELTFAGAIGETGIASGTRVLVFDIGGGSTELVAGRAGSVADWTASLDIGSVRLTERHLLHDPPTHSERIALRHWIEQCLPRTCPAHDELVGLAATLTTLVALRDARPDPIGARAHGVRITCDDVERIADALARTSHAERGRMVGLDPKRSDVILAGAEIARAVLHWSSRESCVASNGGVRIGLLRELCATRHAPRV